MPPNESAVSPSPAPTPAAHQNNDLVVDWPLHRGRRRRRSQRGNANRQMSRMPWKKRLIEEVSRGQTAGDDFSSLRQAVWNRVAETLIMQEEENGQRGHKEGPLNLSGQCSIKGQTIIEHIIENILDQGDVGADHDISDEEVKDKIYQSLKPGDVLKPGFAKSKEMWKALPQNAIRESPSPEVKPVQTETDPGEVSIKSLLESSPVPSSSGSSSSGSHASPLADAVIASVLQQQKKHFLEQKSKLSVIVKGNSADMKTARRRRKSSDCRINSCDSPAFRRRKNQEEVEVAV